MPTFLTSMLVALLVSARNPQKPSTRRVPPSTTLAPAVLGFKCDVPHKHYLTFHITLRLDGGKGCSRYYYITNDGMKELKLAIKEVNKRCDVTLPEGAFTDMYFFDEFMITNFDDGAHIVVNRLK
ncbi:hypothetical protein FOZ63_006139 [Perkinsus olseni]|uniref:Uncharacterized protein n=1 Tax=Perkinsus olseni TaxID=32597 RepID=A0A7J6U954_PEROL|nr:hypothetical protein FOZ60_008920 [Perkinsus olseni]KAF4753948.1 hypothetical protein FOZ62_030575 [Perkinsus olseni]KAF4755716.1 hypothetical protein FOZ63_006139 [Perkinsus olseni]